jgi:hypothetical protein
LADGEWLDAATAYISICFTPLSNPAG